MLYFSFKTNNYCNLHCEYCSNMCDVPINPKNENIFRRERLELSLDDMVLFCERFKGVEEKTLNRLIGAEPTAMPIDKLEEMIECLYTYKRRIALTTNGFNFLGLSENTINKIDRIIFADHVINHELVDECKQYLKPFYKGKIGVVRVDVHYDLEAARHHPMNKGKMCNFMMENPVLWGSTIYPCCALPFVMVFNNNTLIRDELVKAGWTINNEDVVNIFRNWRETLPKYVIDQCKNYCWQPNYTAGGGGTRITLKPHDVIKKMIKT